MAAVVPFETALKVVMVGDSNVGKSQLSLRLVLPRLLPLSIS
jgi:GTPase SAR1 family protein